MNDLTAFKAYSIQKKFIGNVIGESTHNTKDKTYYCQITIKTKTFKVGSTFKPNPRPKCLPEKCPYVVIHSITSQDNKRVSDSCQTVMITVNCNNSVYMIQLEKFI